jgi:hypothetical protein
VPNHGCFNTYGVPEFAEFGVPVLSNFISLKLGTSRHDDLAFDAAKSVRVGEAGAAMKFLIATFALIVYAPVCFAQDATNAVFTVQGTASPKNDNAYGINDAVTLAPTTPRTFAFGQFNHVVLSGSAALFSYVGLNVGLSLGSDWTGSCCGRGYAAMGYEVSDLTNDSGVAATALPPYFYQINALALGNAYGHLNCVMRCTYYLRQLSLGGSAAVSGPNENLNLIGMHIDMPTGSNSGYETWYGIDISEANNNCEITFSSCYAVHDTSTAKNLFGGPTTFMTSLTAKSGIYFSAPGSQTGDSLCWNTSSGQVGANAAGCISSLAKFKNVKSRIGQEALSEVMQLRPIWYTWNQKTHPSYDREVQPGLIAEEVQKIDPRLAAYDDNGRLEGVRYAQLTAVLVTALQAQQAEIEALKAELEGKKAPLVPAKFAAERPR